MTRTILLLFLALFTTRGLAVSLFPAGVESKSQGVDSAVAATGAPAVLYNPANLTLTGKSDPYLEFGAVQVEYSYEHPDFDPVVIQVRSPTVTLGHSYRINNQLAVSALVFPEKRSDQEIPGVPRKAGASMQSVRVTTKESIVNLGFGGSWTPSPSIALGYSTVLTNEKRTVDAEPVDQDTSLVELESSANFYRHVIGSRMSIPKGFVAVSYQTATKKSYKGDQQMAGESSTTSPKVRDFDPGVLRMGLALTFDKLDTTLNINRQFWSAGREHIESGISVATKSADVEDITQVGVGAAWSFPKGWKAGMAFADLPTPWGEGQDTGSLEEHIYGVDFGNLNGVSRRSYAVFSEYDGKGFDLAGSLYHSNGSRELVEGDIIGYYQLAITSLTLSAVIDL